MYTLHDESEKQIQSGKTYASLYFCNQPKGYFIKTDKPQNYTIKIRWNEGYDIHQDAKFSDVWEFAKYLAKYMSHKGIGYSKVSFLLTVEGNPFQGIHRIDITERMSGSINAIFDNLCLNLGDCIECLPPDYFLPKA